MARGLLADQNIEGRSGKSKIETLLNESVKRKKLSEEENQTPRKRKTLSSLEKISSSDLVIEAVFEDLELKQSLYKKIEPYLKRCHSSI